MRHQLTLVVDVIVDDLIDEHFAVGALAGRELPGLAGSWVAAVRPASAAPRVVDGVDEVDDGAEVQADDLEMVAAAASQAAREAAVEAGFDEWGASFVDI